MSKANEPAYPQPPSIFSTEVLEKVQRMYGKTVDIINPQYPGLSKREKLAMEIYVALVAIDGGTESWVIESAKRSLRAADIFFDELNK